MDENRKRSLPPTNWNAIDGDNQKRSKPSTDAMEGDNQKKDINEIINSPPTNTKNGDGKLDSGKNIESAKDGKGRIKLDEETFERAKNCEGDWRRVFTEDGYYRDELFSAIDKSIPDPPPISHEEACKNQRLRLATNALNYFNSKINEGAEYELVEILITAPVVRRGLYIHGNFLAKPKNTSTDTKPKFFFAEMKVSDIKPEPVLRCSILEPDPRDSGQFRPQKIYHPQDMICDWCSCLCGEFKLRNHK